MTYVVQNRAYNGSIYSVEIHQGLLVEFSCHFHEIFFIRLLSELLTVLVSGCYNITINRLSSKKVSSCYMPKFNLINNLSLMVVLSLCKTPYITYLPLILLWIIRILSTFPLLWYWSIDKHSNLSITQNSILKREILVTPQLTLITLSLFLLMNNLQPSSKQQFSLLSYFI